METQITIQEAEDRVKYELSNNEEYKKKWKETLYRDIMMNVPVTAVDVPNSIMEMGTVLTHRDTAYMAMQVAEKWIGTFVEGEKEYCANEWKRRMVRMMNTPAKKLSWYKRIIKKWKQYRK